MMGPKLQDRFNRDITKTRAEQERALGRIQRLAKQDLFADVASEVATLVSALDAVGAALDVLETRVTTQKQEQVTEETVNA